MTSAGDARLTSLIFRFFRTGAKENSEELPDAIPALGLVLNTTGTSIKNYRYNRSRKEKVMSQVAEMSPDQQDHITQLILNELEEQKWGEFYAKTRGRWAALRTEALAERKAELTEELDPDTLPD
jgi:hypothetical protein